jgi:hypothetical protein
MTERVAIAAGRCSFVARLEHKAAPKTFELCRSLLPYHNKVVPARWSSLVLLANGPTYFASIAGPLSGSHFLTVVEGREQLADLGRIVQWEGAQDVALELL